MRSFQPPQLMQMARTVEPPTHRHAPVYNLIMQVHKKWANADRGERRLIICIVHYTLQELCTREHDIEGGCWLYASTPLVLQTCPWTPCKMLV